jgi:hypothetical protein
MTDDEMTNDETAPYTIYVLDLNSIMQEEAVDGIEVAATMKSLAHSLHEIVRGNREATTDHIRYYFMRHVRDLFQFAKTTATTTKLQMILEVLQQAETALNQEEDAEPLLRDAWQLMRKVLSHEDVEKLSASQIELRRSGIDPIRVSGVDVWEQANRILQEWSTQESEDQRVEYIISYSDGFTDGRWLNLPLFYKMHGAGEDFRIGPALDLGNQIIAALETSIDLCSQQHASFEAARYDALAYLKNYAIGGSTGVEAVTTAILKFQKEQWSPGIIYRHALHTEHNRREGVLAQRMGGNLHLHMTYTPSDEVAWGYHLYLAGIYDLQVVKRLATTGQEVAIREVVQDTQTHQTRLDFSVLPGDEDPAVPKDGETVQMTVRQAEAVIASMVFHREEDDSLTVRTNGCDLTYLPC